MEHEQFVDLDSSERVRAVEALSGALKLATNEPSVGLFYVQEHVHKSVPYIAAAEARMRDARRAAVLAKGDADAANDTVRLMVDVGPSSVKRMAESVERALAALQRK